MLGAPAAAAACRVEAYRGVTVTPERALLATVLSVIAIECARLAFGAWLIWRKNREPTFRITSFPSIGAYRERLERESRKP